VADQLVIIGGNTAGLAAALAARRRDPSLRLLVLEASRDISWGACGLPYNLADTARDADDLQVRPAEFFHQRGVTVAPGHRVLSVDAAHGRLEVERRRPGGGERLELAWDRLVVATGARIRSLELPGLPAARLLPLKTLDDLRRWKVTLAGLSRVAVVGAGPLGLELCEALRALGLSVTLLERDELPLPGWPRALREAVAAELAAHGVAFHGQARLQAARDHSHGLRLEWDEDGAAAAVEVDAVAPCLGLEPLTDFLPAAWPRDRRGALAVDAGQRLGGLPVWAAGDCVTRPWAVPARPGEPERPWNPQAREALGGGRVAGWNAAAGDADRTHSPAVGTQVLRCFSLELARCGRLAPETVSGPLPARETPSVRGLLGASMSSPPTHTPADTVPVRRSHAAGRTRAAGLPEAGRLEVWLEADEALRLRGGALLSQGSGAALRVNVLAALLARGGTAAELAALDLAYSPPFGPLSDPLLRAAEILIAR
jgi:NADPH-dependent 2,4-dienoyl-CoA reductase/sulfur reductase-like enzyme